MTLDELAALPCVPSYVCPCCALTHYEAVAELLADEPGALELLADVDAFYSRATAAWRDHQSHADCTTQGAA